MNEDHRGALRNNKYIDQNVRKRTTIRYISIYLK